MVLSNPHERAREGAAEYVRRVLELLGDRKPLEVLAELVPAIRGEIGGLPPQVLREPEAPGKWSILQVVRHLADSELVYRYRMRLIVAQPGTRIPGYDQDAWCARLRYDQDDIEAALGELEVLRKADLDWLRGLSEGELDLAGHHDERGRETVRHIVELLAGHDLFHRAQIERIKWALLAGARHRA